jgi:hypothetical protein
VIDVSSPADALRVLRAVRTLHADEIVVEYLLPLLGACFERHYHANEPAVARAIRTATSYVDVQVFGNTTPPSVGAIPSASPSWESNMAEVPAPRQR